MRLNDRIDLAKHARAALLAFAIATGIAAIGFGFAAVSSPYQFAAIGLPCAVSTLVLLRHRIRAPQIVIARGTQATDSMRLARFLYYLGVVTVALLIVRPAFGTTLSDLLFFVALAAAVAESLMRREVDRIGVPGLSAGALLFLLGGIISCFRSGDTAGSAIVLLRVMYLLVVWLWLSVAVLRTRAHVERAAMLWIMSAAMAGVAALIQFVFGDVIPGTHPKFGRFTGTVLNFNDLGAIAAVAMPVALALAVTLSRRRLRGAAAGALVCFSFTVVALFLSGSVGALLAAVAGTVVLLVVGATRRQTMIVLFVALPVIVGITATDALSPIGRLSVVTNRQFGTQATLFDRVATYEHAWTWITAHPIIGVGLRPPAGSADQLVHNLFLSVWYEAGIFGFIGIVWVLVALWRAALRSAATSRSSPGALLEAGILGSLAATCVQGLSAPLLYQRFAWMPAAIAVAVYASHRRVLPRHDVKSASVPSAVALSRLR
jgi:O-antigen ligase